MTAPKQHSKLILTSGYIVRVVAALRFGSAKWHMQVDAGSPAGFILYETASTSLYFALNVAISTDEMQALLWREELTGETYFERRKGMGYDPETSATEHPLPGL